MYPAIGLIEVSSIARGMVVSDACVKKAPIRLLASRPISPGRYITLFWGDVAEVDEAFREGIETARDTLVDKLFLPGADEQLLDNLTGLAQPAPVDAMGIVETFTVASAILSADAACKAAEVKLLEVRLATGMGGKSYYIVTGDRGGSHHPRRQPAPAHRDHPPPRTRLHRVHLVEGGRPCGEP